MEDFSFDDFKDLGYSAELKDGSKIRIDNWPPIIGIKNLNNCSKILGDADVLAISKKDLHATTVAIMNAENPDLVAKLVTHFCTCVVVDGKRITADSFDQEFEGRLDVVVELFMHVIHSQYHDFFECGLVKERYHNQ